MLSKLNFLCIFALIAVIAIFQVSAQWGNMYNGAYGYNGGLGSNYGVAGGNYNSYAQNTQAYSNQVSAVNYQPYSSYGSSWSGPYSYGSNYGNAYSYPFYGYGGFPGYGYGVGYPCRYW